MASVQNTTSTAGNDYLASPDGGGNKSSSVTDQIQDRFPKLLTTQLKNQDPLNPLDNAQMTSQLAQINTISGIEKMNTTLGKMLDVSQRRAGHAGGRIDRQICPRCRQQHRARQWAVGRWRPAQGSG